MTFRKKSATLSLFFVMLAFGLTLSACGEARGSSSSSGDATKWRLTGAYRVSPNELRVELKTKQPMMSVSNFIVMAFGSTNTLTVTLVESQSGGKKAKLLIEPAMDSGLNYNIGVVGWNPEKQKIETNFVEAQWDDSFLNSFYSDKALGCTLQGNTATIRLFAPRATRVVLCMFDAPYTDYPGKPLQNGEKQISMTRDANGIWEATLTGNYVGKLYGYRVFGPAGGSEDYHPEYIVCDPYSAAVATLQVAPQSHLSVIVKTDTYRWATSQKYMTYPQRSLIIYEAHVRDMTMGSPNITKRGTYEGLVQENKIGGMAHMKELGINAIELLPCQEFDEIEAPYMMKSNAFVYNNWNTYGRNHWGYMTTCFFAPESFYYEGRINAGRWIGASGAQVFAFKQMVDAFHKNGIAVIMDVVYNHVAQYDRNAFKYIDKKYYFKLNANGAYESGSGCGNDFHTARPMTARLIADSCAYWTSEYRVDGFRFDLATMIDWDTFKKNVIPAVTNVHAGSYLSAEPWGGGRYDLSGFDRIGMGAWNDQIRNVVRGGGNAENNRSMGLAYGNANNADMKKAVQAYPALFSDPANAINYIESHDNNTFSDYIRASLLVVKANGQTVMPADYIRTATLDEAQMLRNKVSALFLFTCQGAIMLHEGQEFARMKIVYPPSGESVFPPNSANWVLTNNKWMDGPNKWSSKAQPWTMDHDSYEKDNECNWLPWELKTANMSLFKYYAGLIAIRKKYNAFNMYPVNQIAFIDGKMTDGTTAKSALGWIYDKALSGDDRSFVILVNANKTATVSFTLPAGNWTVMVDGNTTTPAASALSGAVELAPFNGMILFQK